MTGTTISIDAGTIALLGLVFNVLFTGYTALIRMARVELKTDTMWDFMLKGALVEARQKGVVQSNSPLRASREVIEKFGELGRQMRKWYVENALKKKSDSELSLLLVTKFGNALVEEVCLPHGLNMATALMAAVQLCREEDTYA